DHRIFIGEEKLRRVRGALDLLNALRRSVDRLAPERPLAETRKSCRRRSIRQNPQHLPPLNALSCHSPLLFTCPPRRLSAATIAAKQSVIRLQLKYFTLSAINFFVGSCGSPPPLYSIEQYPRYALSLKIPNVFARSIG